MALSLLLGPGKRSEPPPREEEGAQERERRLEQTWAERMQTQEGRQKAEVAELRAEVERLKQDRQLANSDYCKYILNPTLEKTIKQEPIIFIWRGLCLKD